MFERYKIESCDKVCKIHGEQMFVVGPQKVEVCQACGREAIARDKQKIQDEYWEQENKRLEAQRLNTLFKSSILSSELRNADLHNYQVLDQLQKDKLDRAWGLVSAYVDGAKNNTLFFGPPGVGKSHLAFGMLREISDKTKEHAIFIKLPELYSRIKNDFKSPENAEQKWVHKLSKVPFLVLDDLGTEKISDWSKGILFSILDNRNRTIITTNFEESKEIEDRYGAAITDRIFKGVNAQHAVNFKGMKSKRRQFFD